MQHITFVDMYKSKTVLTRTLIERSRTGNVQVTEVPWVQQVRSQEEGTLPLDLRDEVQHENQLLLEVVITKNSQAIHRLKQLKKKSIIREVQVIKIVKSALGNFMAEGSLTAVSFVSTEAGKLKA